VFILILCRGNAWVSSADFIAARRTLQAEAAAATAVKAAAAEARKQRAADKVAEAEIARVEREQRRADKAAAAAAAAVAQQERRAVKAAAAAAASQAADSAASRGPKRQRRDDNKENVLPVAAGRADGMRELHLPLRLRE
jgi:hypothetical protein